MLLWLLRWDFGYDSFRDEVELPLDFVGTVDKGVFFELLLVMLVLLWMVMVGEELLFTIR